MIVFINARLIDPASGHDGLGALRVHDRRIVEIASTLEPIAGEQVIDLAGRVLAPALIDLRCGASLSSGGRSGLTMTAQAAAAGGYGTLVISPDSGLDAPEHFAAIDSCELTSPVRLLPSARLVDANGELCEVGLMLRAGAVFVGDGGSPIGDTRLARRALSYASTFETWVSLRAEDRDLARNTCAHESDLAMRLGLASRPGASERMAVERAAVLAEMTGAKILFDRVTTRDGLAAVNAARRRGLELAATAPITHLVFNEVDAAGFDSRFRLEPPLRSEDDRKAMVAALINGDFEALVSDHTACTGESKAHPFPESAPGSANLEAVLPALCHLAIQDDVSLIDALRPVTCGPADLLGLEQGRLEPGAPADLVAFDPGAPIIHGRDGLICGAPSAFENRRLAGRVLITLVNGAIIHQPEG